MVISYFGHKTFKHSGQWRSILYNGVIAMNQDIFSTHTSLQTHQVQLSPLQIEHENALIEVCKDGRLWELEYTLVPHYSQIKDYIAKALEQKSLGIHVPFVVLNQRNGRIVRTTSFRDLIWEVRRGQIGYIWYAESAQCSHINTRCKLLLL